MLRKKTFLFLLFLLTTFSLFADINNQAILDNLLIDELKYSYILEGKTLPSNFFSFTNQEYNLYSSMINKNYSDFIITQPVNMGINIANAAEFYLHSNKKLKTTNIPFKYQKPLALFDLRFYASSFFYSEIEFNLKRYDTYHKKDFENNIFRTNLFFIPPYIKGVNLVAAVGIDEISKAYFNFGGKNWNIFIGRAQLNQGNGFTGNLIIGDNQEYHDMININTFWKNIKYSYLCSFFAHPSSQKQSQRTPLDGLFFYQQHRIEFSVLQNSLHFALIEGMLYQSKENFVDLRVLNPSTIYHNFYIRSNSNSIIGVECDYTPIKGINIYTQWALDDLNVEGANPPRYPNSFAGLLGVNYTRKINDGLFYLSSEGVYVSPWMYIRDQNDNDGTDKKENQLSFIVDKRYFTDDGLHYKPNYLGYTYGNDCGVFAIKTGYNTNSYKTQGIFKYIVHGTHDINTIWRETNKEEDLKLTKSHKNTKTLGDKTLKDKKNALSHTFIINLNANYKILDGLETYSSIEWEGIVNYQNIKNSKMVNDIKFSIGINFSKSFENLF